MPGVTVGSIINYKVVIEKKPEIEGKFSSNFYFQTYDPTYVCRYKVITHRDTGVNIFIKRDVYTFPDEVNFGTIDLEKLNQNPQTINLLIQTVLVKRRERKGTDFQIKLEYNIPFISIKKEPESQSETYRLDVSLMPERMTRGKIDTLIRVLTNDKEVPEIRIPVVGEIW
jgi:hypothetical protein